MLSRPMVLQPLLDLFPAPRYLEIGVDHGQTFNAIKATVKIAVDPKFHFNYEDRSDANGTVAFHEVTSDRYFGEIASVSDVFDVIFLDGLHVAEQTTRDLLNAIMLLQPLGVIVLDDVIPASYHSSLADTADLVRVRNFLSARDPRLLADQAWMGDVYKVPFFISAFMQQFCHATVSDNHGQTIVWRGRRSPDEIPPYTFEGVGRMEFKDLVKHQNTLNLAPFSEILKKIQNHVINGVCR